jgi:hypothetical protein
MSTSTTWRKRALASVGSAAAMLVLGPVDVAASSTATSGQPTDPPTLRASLTPTVAAPGSEMTYSSVDPCPTAEGVRLLFSTWHEGDLDSGQEDVIPVHDGDVEVEEDGSWTTALPAPDEGGQYEVVASCLTDQQDPGDPGPGDPPVIHGEYSAIDFEVIPDVSEDPNTNTPDTPGTEPGATGTDGVPQAEPARPVPGEPEFTG